MIKQLTKELLVICPSRNRPSLCKQMYDSFIDTEVVSDIIIIVDADDPTITEYKMPIWINNKNYKPTDIYNDVYECFKNKYNYFMCMNDDFIFHTKYWDEIMINAIERKGGWGIAHCRNGMNDALPMTSIISKNIIECTGWLQYPLLEHLCGDLVWRDIGEQINKLIFCPTVYIEHRHFMNNARKHDETDKYTNARERYINDQKTYRQFTKYELKRIKDVVMLQMRKEG